MRTYDRLHGLVGRDDIFAYHSLRDGIETPNRHRLLPGGDTRIIESTTSV
jgi:hypothetical protein